MVFLVRLVAGGPVKRPLQWSTLELQGLISEQRGTDWSLQEAAVTVFLDHYMKALRGHEMPA